LQLRRLGQSDLQVSVISMGCWALAGDSTWGPQDRADSLATIRAALDAGVNFFDTAEAYGNGLSEEIVGEALAPHRSEVVIATKVWADNLSPAKLKAACEASLKRLRTDYIDVYYIHWPSRVIPIEETMQALIELQAEGKIRVAACSNFGPLDLQELLRYGRVEVNQLNYSLLWRAIEYEIRDICVEKQISIACYSPLAQGLLTGKFRSADEVPVGRARTRLFAGTRPGVRHGEAGAEKETFATLDAIAKICREHNLEMAHAALAWLIQQPAVGTVIVGARTPEQIKANAKAGELQLPSEVVAALTAATEELKAKMGPNPDMWQSQSRMR
jgi:myo-inositol catabolism protein IolS